MCLLNLLFKVVVKRLFLWSVPFCFCRSINVKKTKPLILVQISMILGSFKFGELISMFGSPPIKFLSCQPIVAPKSFLRYVEEIQIWQHLTSNWVSIDPEPTKPKYPIHHGFWRVKQVPAVPSPGHRQHRRWRPHHVNVPK